MIRTLFIMIWTILNTIFFGIIVIIISFFSKKGNICHKLARAWAWSILAASRIKVTVKGLSNIDSLGSCIYMPNHQSNFDIPVLLAHLKVQFRWLAKIELFKIPIFGYAMKRAGYISIDRSNRKSAFKSLKRAARIIREGVSVIIFPEGTRNLENNIALFKKGGFVLAVDSGVPIVPVIIHGTREIMPKKKLFIQTRDVILEIKKPIETKDYTRKTKEDLMEKVRQIISDSFEEGKRYNS